MNLKTERQASKIMERIAEINKLNTPVIARYHISDDSVQAELRLTASWKIMVPVDYIHYPKRLGPGPEFDHFRDGRRRDQDENILSDPWWDMEDIVSALGRAEKLSEGLIGGEELYKPHIIKINANLKNGAEKRAEAKAAWQIEPGKAFLADYRQATKKTTLARVRKTITELQARQKAILPLMREANSAYLTDRKNEKEAQKQRNAEALKSGRFWEGDTQTLKDYFHPPFDKNYVADVSEKWRACLILECQSVSYKRYSGDWGHKLAGTGRGYLCGIDDNGDEWGFVLRDLPQSHDQFGDAGLDSTVEEAMANVFGIYTKHIPECTRQGDLLFHPEKIPEDRELHAAESWEPRESHVITSQGMERNGTFFRSPAEIIVTHTSHATVTLPAGEYRLYMSQAADDKD